MTEKQQETYMKTKQRLRRLGKENPADVIVALAEEIDYYREKIHALEEFISKNERKCGNETALVAELRNKQSRDNRALLDRAADRIEELEAECRKQSEGRWEKRTWVVFDSVKDGYRCSECNTTWDTPTKFCPNCGAMMKGD